METIGKGIENFPLDGGVRRWLLNGLQLREILAEVEGKSFTRRLTRGTAQGGVNSPLLWCMAIDQLIKRIKSKFSAVHVQIYADDVSLLITGIDAGVMKDIMQQALVDTQAWCRDHGLKINPNKTDAIMFTLRRKWNKTPLRLDGVDIELKRSVKYLGVFLDQRLHWNDHVENQVRKAKMILHQSRRIIGRTWGLNPRSTRWLYTAMVRPMITYGCCVWAPALEKKMIQNKLTKIQRMACLAISGAMRSTPTAGMELILGLPPLDLTMKGEALKCATRLKRTKRWRSWWSSHRGMTRVDHVHWIEREMAKMNIGKLPHDYDSVKFHFENVTLLRSLPGRNGSKKVIRERDEEKYTVLRMDREW